MSIGSTNDDRNTPIGAGESTNRRNTLDVSFLSDNLVSEVNANVDQKLIVITEDKFEIWVMKHSGKLSARDAWHAPLALVVALLTVFCTTTFRDWLLPAATWQGVFAAALVFATGWLGKCAWRSRRGETFGEALRALKGESLPHTEKTVRKRDASD